jgi:tetratricopeptide (TPR) repeat protein
MLRFISNTYRPFAYELFKIQAKRFSSTSLKPNNGQEALNYIRTLYENKSYEGALKMLTKIEEQYPECTKAAKYYRGKVSMALLEQEGTLEKLHLTTPKNK